jgi:hypothetical protein
MVGGRGESPVGKGQERTQEDMKFREYRDDRFSLGLPRLDGSRSATKDSNIAPLSELLVSANRRLSVSAVNP